MQVPPICWPLWAIRRWAAFWADVRMPAMTGLELLEELGRRDCPLPVIMITGHGDVPMAVRAMRAGAMDFFEKPVNGMALVERINEALRLSNERAQLLNERTQLTRQIESLTARDGRSGARGTGGAAKQTDRA